MVIGIFSFYPFRPHTSHAKYIQRNLEQLGHEVIFYKCDGRLGNCFYQLSNDNSTLACVKCSLRIKRTHNQELSYSEEWMAKSVLATINRIESWTDEIENNYVDEINRYTKDLKYSQLKFSSWLKNNNIKFVFGFNGRMDHTAVFFEACRSMSVPFVSFESLWFGNGIQFLKNEDCLSLKLWHETNIGYRDKSLSLDQIKKVSPYVIKKLNRSFEGEWRSFALRGQFSRKSKLLILPSSRSEFLGHPEYVSNWKHSTVGFDSVVKKLDLRPEEVVVKAHPIWSQSVRGVKTDSALELYRSWASSRGYIFLDDSYDADTHLLADQTEFVCVNGSSAAIELGLKGIQIILVEKAKYSYAGFCIDYYSDNNEIERKNALEIINRTIRFVYTVMFRIGSLEDKVRYNQSVVSYLYQDDLDFFKRIISNKAPIINDPKFGSNQTNEFAVIKESNINDTNPFEGYEIKSVKEMLRSVWKKGDQ